MSSQEQSNIRVVGPYREVPNLADDLQSYLQDTRSNLIVPGEAQKTDEELRMIEQISESLAAVCDEIGVGVRSRLLLPRDYHFFDSRKDFDDAARAVGQGDIPGGGGVYFPNMGLWWVRRKEKYENVTGMAHEGAHSVSLHTARMVIIRQEVVDGDTHNSLDGKIWHGCQFPGGGLKEVVTDMLARRAVLHDGWKKMLYSYFCPDTICTELVDKAARQHDMNPKDVESLLIEGMLTGHSRGFRLLAGAIGTLGMRELVRSSGYEEKEVYLDFARRHGLTRSAEILEADIAGERVDMPFQWNAHSSSDAPAPIQEAPTAPAQELTGLLGAVAVTVSRLAFIEAPQLADMAADIRQDVSSALELLQSLDRPSSGSGGALAPQIEALNQAIRKLLEAQELLAGRDTGVADTLQRYLSAISGVNYDW